MLEIAFALPAQCVCHGASAIDLRNPAIIRLIFIALVATVGGLPSGLAMGLFILVYEDGHRRGVLPPQPERIPLGVREAFPTVAKLASRLRGGES